MRESRLARFVGGVGLGYVQTVVVVVAGLWLTPYVLRQLGQHHYGLWLLAAQFIAYFGLLDLGVVALLPRDVAYASGVALRGDVKAIRAHVELITTVVLWQTPLVAVIALVAWWLVPASWSELRAPLGTVLIALVALFPLRIFPNVLQGLQDLTYLGAVQLGGWLGGTVVTIGLLVTGFGLHAVACGWIVTQCITSGLSWRRLCRRFPTAVPRLTLRPEGPVMPVLQRGMWICVNQIAQVLLNGTDLVVIGTLLGPAAVVVYSCTGRLITLLANQPQMFMQLAVPALSALRAEGSRRRLFDVSTAMSQVMLFGSGAVACVTFAVNRSFVEWWVGGHQFGGAALTALMLAAMLLRHLNLTASYTLFAIGYERRLAITAIVDGVLTSIAMFALIPLMGVNGAAIASIVGAATVSLPINLLAVAREQGVSIVTSLVPLRLWAVRFALLIGSLSALSLFWTPSAVIPAAMTAASIAAIYLMCMRRLLSVPPAGPILSSTIEPWLAKLTAIRQRDRESIAA